MMEGLLRFTRLVPKSLVENINANSTRINSDTMPSYTWSINSLHPDHIFFLHAPSGDQYNIPQSPVGLQRATQGLRTQITDNIEITPCKWFRNFYKVIDASTGKLLDSSTQRRHTSKRAAAQTVRKILSTLA